MLPYRPFFRIESGLVSFRTSVYYTISASVAILLYMWEVINTPKLVLVLRVSNRTASWSGKTIVINLVYYRREPTFVDILVVSILQGQECQFQEFR